MNLASTDNHQGKASRAVIRLLGRLLGAVIREQYGDDEESLKRGREDFYLVETTRQQWVEHHRDGFSGEIALDDRLRDLDRSQAALLIRAFSIFSQLANIADDHLAHNSQGTSPLQRLELYQRVNAKNVGAYLSKAMLSPVITAHPTEVRRKSILDRETAIASLLTMREHANQQTSENAEIEAQLKREIRTLWQTRMFRAERIHVKDEIENAVSVFARTFLPQLPLVKRRLAHLYGLNGDVVSFLKPGSWVGGDRDGNPFVSAGTLEHALRRQAEAVLDYYLGQVHQLGTELSLSEEFVSATPELKALAASPEHTTVHQLDEPYRRALITCYSRLAATRKLLLGRGPARPPRFEAEPYPTAEAFAADLNVIVDSLRQNGDADLADGRLLNLREGVGAFGFHLAVIDLRQNSDVHERAVGDLLREAGVVEDYAGLSEAERVRLLSAELASPRLLRSPYRSYSEETRRELDIADKAAELKRRFGECAIGNYVISKSESVSDLLETAALMKEAGLFACGKTTRASLRIVPLFETIGALRESDGIMASFFDLPFVPEMLAVQGGVQEVMIGYSDSNKEGGYFTSYWEIRSCIARLTALGNARGISMRFFHGRGGAVGRGGGESYEAIRALPAGASASGIRITEQGEIVSSKYGYPAVGRSSLETIVVAAILSQLGHEADTADGDGAALLSALSAAAYRVYRGTVYETEGFERYFRESTPLPEISDLNIGSRPASRSKSRRIEDLRAIPWVFSWSQARVMLPGWFGFGSAAAEVGTEALADLYRTSPFFRTTVSNMEMVLAKSSLPIARRYSELVADPALAERIFALIAAEWQRTVNAVLAVTGQTSLLSNNPRLMNSIRLRLPYTDALNHLQLDLLRRRRAGDESIETLRAIHMSINGVSAGLRNSG